MRLLRPEEEAQGLLRAGAGGGGRGGAAAGELRDRERERERERERDKGGEFFLFFRTFSARCSFFAPLPAAPARNRERPRSTRDSHCDLLLFLFSLPPPPPSNPRRPLRRRRHLGPGGSRRRPPGLHRLRLLLAAQPLRPGPEARRDARGRPDRQAVSAQPLGSLDFRRPAPHLARRQPAEHEVERGADLRGRDAGGGGVLRRERGHRACWWWRWRKRKQQQRPLPVALVVVLLLPGGQQRGRAGPLGAVRRLPFEVHRGGGGGQRGGRGVADHHLEVDG